jgi:hypothetical protein
MTGTDTGLAFVGEPEWVIAGLVVLGIPMDEAVATWRVFLEEEFEEVPDVRTRDFTYTVRVCQACVDASGAPLTVGLIGGGVPGYHEPPAGPRRSWLPRRRGTR